MCVILLGPLVRPFLRNGLKRLKIGRVKRGYLQRGHPENTLKIPWQRLKTPWKFLDNAWNTLNKKLEISWTYPFPWLSVTFFLSPLWLSKSLNFFRKPQKAISNLVRRLFFIGGVSGVGVKGVAGRDAIVHKGDEIVHERQRNSSHKELVAKHPFAPLGFSICGGALRDGEAGIQGSGRPKKWKLTATIVDDFTAEDRI